MIVLGIDPGFARLGYGIIDYSSCKYKVIEYGTITTKAGDLLHDRLKKISYDLKEVISRYKIDSVAIEELFFNTNTKTAIHVAEARGVILLTLAEANIDIYEYTPLQAKQAVVGYGRADKKQMQDMVKRFLKLEKMPKLDDTTDALGLAICHIHSHKFTEKCKKTKTQEMIERLARENKKCKIK
ncbi:MAG: crossover junction endodeoxyribonuclease RuvC [Clostridia bacterium]|nr:crossover junction endodeoxyribonuclease RuvC [Clostridia bacterium]MDD4375893.1 crossover junction endodeoxyribonuclease RuvC [Clostridia bacterium]